MKSLFDSYIKLEKEMDDAITRCNEVRDVLLRVAMEGVYLVDGKAVLIKDGVIYVNDAVRPE